MTVLRLGQPAFEAVPSLFDGCPKLAALSADKLTEAGQHFGLAEQIAQNGLSTLAPLVVPNFEQILADVGEEVEMAGQHRRRKS